MNKIKNLMKKISVQVKELIKNYPITMILILFVTLLIAILVEQNFSDEVTKTIEKIGVFCVVWGFGTYFTENYFSTKAKKIISYVITGVISLFFTRAIFSDFGSYASLLERSLCAYLIVLFSMSIFKVIEKRELDFSSYLMNLFKNLVNYTIIYFILAVGISILTLIFVELILDGNYNGSGILRLEILLFGWYYISSLLYGISGLNKKQGSSFAKGLVLYVLLPLVIMAMLIIYLYIAKIIILRNMPKNIIFRILAGIFIMAFPVWNMASYYREEKKWIQKITSILPYLYIPFFFLEIYSIGVRIHDFGITPARYISCAFIVFQLIAIFLNIYKKKEKMDLLFIVIAIFGIILLITPFNFERVSNLSQKRMIEKYLKENSKFQDLDEDAKEKVKGAYLYLTRQNAEKYLPNYLSEDMIQQIKQYQTTLEAYTENYSYFYDNKELDLNIEPYAQITAVSGMVDNDTIVRFDEINQKIDLSELLEQVLKKDKVSKTDAKQYFKANNLVYIDELHDLYITSINFEYIDENVKYLSVDGYWLTRRAEEYKKKSSKIVPEKNEDIEIQKDFNEAVNQLDKNVFLTDFENYSWASNEVKITENEAKEIAQKGFEESWRRIAGEGVDNIESQRIVMREESPNNYFTRYYFDGDKIYTDIKRNCYVVTRTNEMGNGISIYVDSNTGLIIGGEAFGD